MGNRKRKKKWDSTINKKKGGKKMVLGEGDTTTEKKNPPPEIRMDAKKSDKTHPSRIKVKEDITFLGTVQKRWDRLVGYVTKQADNIINKIHIRKRHRHTVSDSKIIVGTKEEGDEENVRKRKQEEPAPSRDDVSDDCSGPSNKHRKTTVPLTLDKFILLSVLGEGSYGKVLLATDVIRNENVALKMVKKRCIIEFPESLVEQQILRITHKNNFLIHGYGAFHTENYAYFVTELAHGGDLCHYVWKNHLHMDTIRFITAEIICGLKFLHANGIVHRDMKLDNVLLTGDGHAKITDFGLALCGVYERVNARDYPGTPGYGAPEMILGHSYNAGVDWFALGVILYNMIFRCKAFPGENCEDIERKVLHSEPSYGNLTDHVTLDILARLLFKDQSIRLGVNGDIKNHPFFSSMNWTDIETGKAASPVVIRKPIDVFMSQHLLPPCSEDVKKPIPSKQQGIFADFQFVCPAWSTTYH
ncbi:protein kinase C delta type-like [Engystomops pustulosus]|uniref:protein kinase C delta type-like n=1 Tax=Engystomops pustulosus TaxID=76066 RepID=UPI003AFB2AEB